MTQEMITRRKAFAAAGAAAGALGATAALSGVLGVQAAGVTDHSIVGTWSIVVQSSAGQASTTLIGFAAGGSLFTTDNAGPGNISVGAWEQEGKSFRVVFQTFIFDNNGDLMGTSTVRPQGTIDGDGDHVHGTYKIDFQPESGPPQHDVQHGTFSGGRLKA
jgi:hypothetical protein